MVTALILAATAAFFSISGLSQLFSGAKTSVIIMASSIELGKLVAVSLLYRAWKDLNTILKTYLYVGIIVMVLITSAGIYGFLSSAYSNVSRQSEHISSQVQMLTNQKEFLLQDVAQYKLDIDNSRERITSLSSARNKREDRIDVAMDRNQSASARRTENSIKGIGDEIKSITTEITSSQGKISDKNDAIRELDLKILTLNSDNSIAELGPLKYISSITGVHMDRIANWLMLILIFVFDPLAVALLIGANTIFVKQSKIEDMNLVIDHKVTSVTAEPEDLKIQSTVTPTPEFVEEDNTHLPSEPVKSNTAFLDDMVDYYINKKKDDDDSNPGEIKSNVYS